MATFKQASRGLRFPPVMSRNLPKRKSFIIRASKPVANGTKSGVTKAALALLRSKANSLKKPSAPSEKEPSWFSKHKGWVIGVAGTGVGVGAIGLLLARRKSSSSSSS